MKKTRKGLITDCVCPGEGAHQYIRSLPVNDQNLTSITLTELMNEEEGDRRTNGLHIPRKNVSKTFDD